MTPGRATSLLLLLALVGPVPAAAPPAFLGRDLQGDPLPPGAVARFGTVRLRQDLNSGNAHAQLFFRPDGRVLLAGAETGLYLWDLHTGESAGWLPPLPGLKAATLLPDGKTLVTARLERSQGRAARGVLTSNWFVQRWRWGEKAPRDQEPFLASSGFPGVEVALLSADGKLLVGWGYSGLEPSVWETASGRLLYRLDRKALGVTAVALSPDGKQLVLVSQGGGLHVYEAATGKHRRALVAEGPSSPLLSSTYAFPRVSPDGLLLVVSGNEDLFLWDLGKGEQRGRREGLRGPAAFSPDGKYLACAGRRAIHLLDARSLELVRIFEPHGNDRVFAVAFTPNGRQLVLGGGWALSLWDVATGKPLPRPPGHLSAVRALAFSPDGSRLASGANDGTAYVWDRATGRALHAFGGHPVGVVGLAFSPDGLRLATGDGIANGSDGREAQVRVFDLRRGAGPASTSRLVRQFSTHLHAVRSLLFSPDGKKLATGGGDDRVRVWDVDTGRRLGQVRHLFQARPVAFRDGGKTLLIQTPTEALTADLNSWEVTRPADAPALAPGLPVERSRSPTVRSPDNMVVACAGGRFGDIDLWDVTSGKRFATLTGHTGYLSALAFSPDGMWLASGSYDTTVLLWDVGRARLQYVLEELLAGRGDVRHLAAFPTQGVAALAERLRQAARSEVRAARLIRDLDDESFEVRERASRDLEKLGAEAAFALRQAVEAGPSVEVKARARRLLDRLDARERESAINPERVRRALALLVNLGSAEAQRALEELAGLDASTLVGREARKALEAARAKKKGR